MRYMIDKLKKKKGYKLRRAWKTQKNKQKIQQKVDKGYKAIQNKKS